MVQAYEVVDTRNNRVVFTTNSSVAAYESADRRDASFGAVRFSVRRDHDVMSDEEFASFMQVSA